MASPQVGSIPPKMSFAKVHTHHDPLQHELTNLPQVAAMHVPNPHKTSNNLTEDKNPHSKESSNRRSTVISPRPQLPSPSQTTPQPAKAVVVPKAPDTNGDAVAVEGLSLISHVHPSANGVKSTGSADSNGDDQSQLSNSSTKQRSFETKSMASVTTFAMDEKESIRPDDSASVRAGDDDDLVSTLSRNTSFHQESSVIMPTLRGGAGVPGLPLAIAARRYPTMINPPRFGDLEPPPVPQSEVDQSPSSSAVAEQPEEPNVREPPPPVSPDEKLLDALASAKDRLSILQLEERLLAFVRQSNIDFMDLPPQNSYARLLAHKLADYYSLLHRINEDGASIRIFRTNASTLPTPLTILAHSIPVGSSQSLPTAMKIMRRAGVGPRQLSTTNSTAPSSSGVPSKTTSEAGHSEEAVTSPTEASTPSRNKSNMTRDEREAQYKAARERIFGDFQELAVGENVSTGENSASMSRSSSSSGKKKTRRQKTPKDDSFDSRSAFVAGYGGVHVQPVQPLQPAYQTQQYLTHPYQNQYDPSLSSYGTQIDYGSTPTQSYNFDQSMPMTSPATFGPMSPQSFSMLEAWPNMQPQQGNGYFNNHQPSTGYQQSMSPMMPQVSNQYVQQAPPSMQYPTGWANAQYPNPYQPQMSPMQPAANWQNFQPQQYSQMPNQFGMTSPMSPQPQVSSHYNRSLFNPQTRSFIPGGPGTRPKSGRKKNSSGLNQPQSRNSSGTKSHTSSTPPAANMLPSRRSAQDLDRSSLTSSQGPSEESLQKKYGAPANLPKKPPPPRIVSQFDAGSISNVKSPGATAALSEGVNDSKSVEDNGDEVQKSAAS